MKTVLLSGLFAAGVALAGAASAQETTTAYVPTTPYTSSEQDRTPSQWSWVDSWRGDLGAVSTSNPFETGVAALQASDFVRAEEMFARSLLFNRNDVTLRFYMGVAKMNLGKWDEAKRYLKTPARELRKLPDPKSHLGVTYAKLGDIAGATAQRAALVRMAEACGQTCRLAPSITRGIEMIDEALAQPATPGRVLPG